MTVNHLSERAPVARLHLLPPFQVKRHLDGISRHAGLKNPCRKAYECKSHRCHHLRTCIVAVFE